jgi:WD40 repeat protein
LPDDTVASASVDKTIRIWNPNNGDLIRELVGHTESVLCLTLLNDELYVASGSADKTIIIWNTSENKIIRKLISHSAEVYSLCVIENGTKLASGSYKEIKIWNVFSGQLLNTLTGYFYHVYSLVQLENGCLVSSGGFSINIWNLNNVIKSSIILDEQKNTILSLAILSDDRLASGSSDSIVRIWNINTCALIKALKGHGQGVW